MNILMFELKKNEKYSLRLKKRYTIKIHKVYLSVFSGIP